MILPRRYEKKLLFGTVLMIAVGIMGYGLYGLWVQYSTTHQAQKPIQADSVVTHSTSTPDETPPLCDTYKTSASQPRYIDLPTVKASGCLQKVGIDQNNAMAVPDNIHLAGWYVNSVIPGEVGLSVIDGHSGGRYSDGIFKHLADLKVEDKFTVEFGDKSIKNFQVLSITTYGVDEAAKKMLEKDTGITNQLNLITCGSSYNTNTKSYEDRVLAVAEAI